MASLTFLKALLVNFTRKPSRRAVITVFLTIIAWRAEVTGGQLNLNWRDPFKDQLGFSIERSTGPTGAFFEIATTGPGATAYTDSTVTEAANYCYRVRAFNAAGYSDYSNTSCGSLATALPGSINVTAVTYGASCGVPTECGAGLRARCDRQSSCEYLFYYGSDCGFDPALGCKKDLTVTYQCGGGPTQALYVPAEAGLNSDILMTCSAISPSGPIDIAAVTYGASCGVPTECGAGLRARCDGQSNCEYLFDYASDCGFDPALGCKKDLTVTYQCGGGLTQALYFPAEAGFNSDIALSCL